jgi:hypothetical protein
MPAFKNYQRTPRNLTTEQLFNKGMLYTDIPLLDGNSKLLVNYNIAPEGNMIYPRAGYHKVGDIDIGVDGYRIHHTAQMTGFDTDKLTDYSLTYTLLYNDYGYKVMFNDELYDIVYDNVSEIKTDNLRDVPSTLHKIPFQAEVPLPVYTTLNGSTILPVEQGLAILSSSREADVTRFTLRPVVPTTVNPSEASASGYNMLLEQPYAFSDDIGGAMTLTIQGIVPQDLNGNVLFSARAGELVQFRAYYATNSSTDDTAYTVLWEVYSLDNSKPTIKKAYTNVTINPSAPGTVLSYIAPADYKEFGVRCTIYTGTWSEDPTVSTAVPVTTGVYSNYKMYDKEAKSIDPIAYNLNTATGMCTWMQHVVLWGTSRGRNIVFISELARPGYFPFPFNAQIFDEDVVSCVPYLNGLLVFTTTKLHKLAWLPGGSGFTSTVLQEKLQLTQFDHRTICVVQTMVFFKSGDYYYLMVPKATPDGVGALQMAPISTPITKMLDNIGPVVKSTFGYLYEALNNTPMILRDYINYQDNGILRCIYKFEVSDGVYVDFYLNYSTVLRTWTTYMMQSTKHNMCMYKYGVTDGSIYATIVDQSMVLVSPSADIRDDFVAGTVYNNIQLIDTGYREHNTATKKRYREIQFKVNNLSRRALQFGSMFYLDEQIRKDLYNYTVEQQGDELVVVPTYADPAVLAGHTVLSDDNDLYLEDTMFTTPSEEVVLKTNTWQLDVSSLTEPAVVKVRFKVSGKGYSPRLVLVSLNLVPYELLGFNWVFRTMNAR